MTMTLRRKNIVENNRIIFFVLSGFITILIAERQNEEKLSYKIKILFKISSRVSAIFFLFLNLLN